MLKETKKMIEECDKLIKDLMSQISVEDVMEMGDDNIRLMKGLMTTYDASKEMMLKQATAIEDINDKLDIIVKKMYEVKPQ